MKSLSHVWLPVTPWTAAYQAPPSMGLSRQEYWSGVPDKFYRWPHFEIWPLYADGLWGRGALALLKTRLHQLLTRTMWGWLITNPQEANRSLCQCSPGWPGLGTLRGYLQRIDCVDHNKPWKILKEMGIPDHLTWLLRNLYAGQEATVRPGHGTTDWFQIGKGVRQGCILSPCLFNLYAEYIMRNTVLEEAQAGI